MAVTLFAILATLPSSRSKTPENTTKMAPMIRTGGIFQYSEDRANGFAIMKEIPAPTAHRKDITMI